MNRVLLAIVMLLAGSTALAGTLMNRSWSDLKASGNVTAGEIVNHGGREMLKVSNTTSRELRVTVLAIDKPGVTDPSYSISAVVEYQGVDGRGYLEILSYFPPPKPGPFFSRPPGRSGPLGWLTSGNGKAFEMMFSLRKGEPKPIRLELNVVLPGRSTAYLGPIKLVQNRSGSHGRVILGKWRSDRELGRIGGTFGGIVGGFGGLIGVFGGIIGTLAGKGKARAFVLGTIKTLIGLAILLLIVGLVMVLTGQWWVFYIPLFFMGLLLLAIMTPMLPMIRARYDELELRRISAQDAGG